jgi:hypothetical protein
VGITHTGRFFTAERRAGTQKVNLVIVIDVMGSALPGPPKRDQPILLANSGEPGETLIAI